MADGRAPIDLLDLHLAAIHQRSQAGYPQTTVHEDGFIPAREDVAFLLAEVERLRAETAELKAEIARLKQQREWQPIETAPRNEIVLFWIISKTADETYLDGSGKPIVTAHAPYHAKLRYGQWGALSKATHWMSIQELAGPSSATET